jgi:hypothetical protein
VIRRLAPLAFALVTAGGWLVVPGLATDVRAATPDLTFTSAARYDVQPDKNRLRVTVDLSLTNHLKDTRTKRYYFDHLSLVVVPGASDPALTWAGSGRARASVAGSSAKATTLRLDLAQRLYSGKSASYRLTFDVVDRGGPSTRTVRIGGSLVRFPVWAYASNDTPGSTVRVVFPAGFEASVASGRLPGPTTDATGRAIFQSARLKTPLTFFAYLVANRPGATASRVVKADVSGTSIETSVVSWADDPAWAKRVGSLVRRALPLLSDRIGLPWQREGGLVFREALGRSSGGYAGLYDPAAGTVDIAFDATDPVVIHEAAHAWFDGALLADRWADEGFASYYGRAVASALKVKVKPSADALTPAFEAARIPLNDWGPVGETDAATDDYAYAASLALARAIAERAGPAALQAVWADASERIGAYQPAGDLEMVDGAPDWRGLLDLLEDRTGVSFDDLWRTWVARDPDLDLLDQRAVARDRYAALVTAAGDWMLPQAIRDAMRAWRFDEATSLMLDAQAILDQRAAITARADALGLAVPDTVRERFEQPDGFGDALQAARDEAAAIDRYEAADALRPTSGGTIEDVGLWGLTPDADLAQARTKFAAGDLTGSADSAAAAAAAWSGAADVGRGRLMSVGILAVAGLLAVVLAAAWFRGRRGRRRPRNRPWTSLDLDT